MQQKYVLGQTPLGFHQVAYTEWGHKTAAPPVLCVHGLTRNGRDFDRLAENLQAQRQVYCPDIVGRGQSDFLADPALYNYPQYIADMTALIARIDSPQIDWVGTSMGGIIGMFMAAMPRTPIRRLVVNDIGPFIPLAALQRIASYVGTPPEFSSLAELEKYLRTLYAAFGIRKDEDWKKFAENSSRRLPDGRIALAYDPAIAQNFAALETDVDFWNVFDRITCPVLVLRGRQSDILTAEVAAEMTRRGPKAQLIEIADAGHAPALIDAAQIQAVARFLDPV